VVSQIVSMVSRQAPSLTGQIIMVVASVDGLNPNNWRKEIPKWCVGIFETLMLE